MRKLLTSLLWMTAIPAFTLSVVEADSLVAEGERAYAAGDPATALARFDSARTAFTSPALLYNIGNCHFKLGDIPHAILFYERALRLAPGDPDIRTNLELARQNVVDRVNELPGFTLGSTWSRIRGGRDADQWARRSLWICLVLFMVLAAAVVARQRMLRRSLLILGAVLFLGTLLSIGFAASRHRELTDDSEAIIMSAKVDVRSEPKDGSTVLFVLHKGTKVTILQQQQGWSEVQLANGNVGWMPPATLERI
ncbi:MAG TPA: tetratricopeptide repeat protein [Flavobacteriales bacterium]|nr:tetratricopeptide repeat protein [Flavobacteriales bacterium]HNU56932.1 tetratricopeptide repeat protein [Flavobacteriales bacterium]